MAKKAARKSTSSKKSFTSAMKDKMQSSSGTPSHIIVNALAGTGKTTTNCEGLNVLLDGSSRLTPSPQQRDIWDQLCLSKDARRIATVAFNKSIARELSGRVPAGVDACTMHSLGLKTVANRYGRLRIPKDPKWCVRERVAKVYGRDLKMMMKDGMMPMIEACRKLVSLVKMNLADWNDEQALDAILSYYEIDTNGSRRQVLEIVPEVMDLCMNPSEDGQMDYDDMIWLPVINGLQPASSYDLLLVDEAQDLNKCQQQLAIASGRRLIFVGDRHQAIYGFAGADSQSLPNLFSMLQETDRGCIELPLTVTRRCGKAIVTEAQKYVPEFEAHETNPDGAVSYMTQSEYLNIVEDGDMILSRVNAPLVSQCFKFLKQGRKATIQGRDIGAGLVSLVKKQKVEDIDSLSAALSEWYHAEVSKEQAKRQPSDTYLANLEDKYDCLSVFMEDTGSATELIGKIESIFTDNDTGGIKLSSIHRAKGLEASTVHFLRTKDAPCPHPMAKADWAREQENNLLYVAITRAINRLNYVTDDKSV